MKQPIVRNPLPVLRLTETPSHPLNQPCYSFLEAVIKQARSFSCLFNLRILMPRHGNSKSFPAVPERGVWQIPSAVDHTRSRYYY